MIPLTVDPIAEFHRRIRRSIATGKTLCGLKFYESFAVRNEKADDLPRLYLIDYSDKETYAGGGPLTGNGINAVVRQTVTLTIQLVVDMKNGWFTTDTSLPLKKQGLVNVKNAVLDAIETDDAGNTDGSLGGSLEKPIMFQTKESGIFDLGLVMDITVTLDGLRFDRGTRSSLIESQ